MINHIIRSVQINKPFDCFKRSKWPLNLNLIRLNPIKEFRVKTIIINKSNRFKPFPGLVYGEDELNQECRRKGYIQHTDKLSLDKSYTHKEP